MKQVISNLEKKKKQHLESLKYTYNKYIANEKPLMKPRKTTIIG